MHSLLLTTGFIFSVAVLSRGPFLIRVFLSFPIMSYCMDCFFKIIRLLSLPASGLHFPSTTCILRCSPYRIVPSGIIFPPSQPLWPCTSALALRSCLCRAPRYQVSTIAFHGSLFHSCPSFFSCDVACFSAFFYLLLLYAGTFGFCEPRINNCSSLEPRRRFSPTPSRPIST